MMVLVTGADGFLGRAIVAALHARGVRTTTLGRRAEGVAGSAGRVRVDLAAPAELDRALTLVDPDVVVNCAAQVDWGSGVLAALYGANVLAPAIIADFAAKRERVLLQVSGTLVHGTAARTVEARSARDPDTDYGRSKALAEDVIAASGCRACIVRLGGVFGASGPDHLGINRAIRAARAGTPPVLVGEGRARRNYIHVSDAAAAIARAAESGLVGTHLLGGRDVSSIAEMLQAICDVHLPGTRPTRREGPEAGDQIVRTSPALDPGTGFADALRRDA